MVVVATPKARSRRHGDTLKLKRQLVRIASLIVVIPVCWYILVPNLGLYFRGYTLDDSILLSSIWQSSITEEDWKDFQADYQQRFRRQPPSTLRQWLKFARAKGCDERNYYKVIDQDMETFRQQIQDRGGRKFDTSEVVPSGQKQTDNYIAFELQENDLIVVASRNINNNQREQAGREAKLRLLLAPLVHHQPPLYGIYFFDLHDHPTQKSTPDTLPVFASSRIAYVTDDQLPPKDGDANPQIQVSHSATNPQYPDSYDSRVLLVPYYNSVQAYSFETYVPSWNSRRDAIVWRGSTTGYSWDTSPRFVLMRQFGGTAPHWLAENVPVEADFAFVNVVQDDGGQKTLPPSTRTAFHMTSFQAKQYKYYLDIDGNAFSMRFPQLLRWGFTVVKSTRFREWYSERLKPFVDYVPVSYNLSDLVDKVAWLHQHPKQAKQIMEHGMDVSNNYLRDEDMQCYTYRLMLEYHTLFEN